MDLTPQQLSQYNGTDASKPLYVAVKGRIFDVTNGKSFYGPGGPYAMFAGKDASRALAKMSKNDEDVTPSLDGLSDKEIGVLNDWEKKFEAKYPVVGRVVSWILSRSLFICFIYEMGVYVCIGNAILGANTLLGICDFVGTWGFHTLLIKDVVVLLLEGLCMISLG